MTLNNKFQVLIQDFVNSNGVDNGALLPLLHHLQDTLGFIPPEAVADISKALNLSRAEVHGVITYYHFFRNEPAGKYVLQICRAESCQACGADELLTIAEQKLGCKSHQTSPSGAVTLESVYCLGLCANSPAIQIGDKLHARVSPKKLTKLLAELEASV
jgi:formate dehydrogenase subunit gamma